MKRLINNVVTILYRGKRCKIAQHQSRISEFFYSDKSKKTRYVVLTEVKVNNLIKSTGLFVFLKGFGGCNNILLSYDVISVTKRGKFEPDWDSCCVRKNQHNRYKFMYVPSRRYLALPCPEGDLGV